MYVFRRFVCIMGIFSFANCCRCCWFVTKLCIYAVCYVWSYYNFFFLAETLQLHKPNSVCVFVYVCVDANIYLFLEFFSFFFFSFWRQVGSPSFKIRCFSYYYSFFFCNVVGYTNGGCITGD